MLLVRPCFGHKKFPGVFQRSISSPNETWRNCCKFRCRSRSMDRYLLQLLARTEQERLETGVFRAPAVTGEDLRDGDRSPRRWRRWPVLAPCLAARPVHLFAACWAIDPCA